ncbi:MAG TPA: phospholipid carrier-dependent glycosyltransferase, partial [Candidatus Limnocylindrales bacterium]
TATEFLQDWRYGEPHSIYEYTHPHLAKYAMAAGVVLFADDRVIATSDLGVPVSDAVIERRWDDASASGGRAGDRLYVATGSELRAYDLETRAEVARLSLPGAAALGLDGAGHRLFVGAGHDLLTIDTGELDLYRQVGASAGGTSRLIDAVPFGSVDGQIRRLFVTDDGAHVLAATTDDRLVSIDGQSGAVRGSLDLPGIAGMASASTRQALVARPAEVGDPEAEASIVAEELGGDSAGYVGKLGSTADRVVLGAPCSSDVRDRIQGEIGDGRLAGLALEDVSQVAIADADGLAFVDPASAALVDTIGFDGGATGLAFISGLDAPRLYVASAASVKVVKLDDSSDKATCPSVEATIAMPGQTREVTYDPSSQQVHVLGRTTDDSAATIYVIEPHGNAVYADARLPFEPAAWATDVAPDYPAAEHQAILAFDAGGAVAEVDIGRHAFAWRLPGVLAGALTLGLLYLLARILFRRRSVGVLVGLLALADGMLFVQSRIAMNDVYVGLFIVAAYALFAAVWTGAWRWRGAFWVAMPVIGFLLGLALASKWVAAYAIAGMGMLILARSALGRIILVAALVGATTILGYVAVSVPSGETSSGNLAFMLLMIGLTLAAVLVTVLHPIAWSPEETRFAVAAPLAVAILGLAAAVPLGMASQTVIGLALGLVVAAAGVLVALRVAASWGLGPLAPPVAPDDPIRLVEPPAPAPVGWLRLGSGFGLPAVWMAGCLLVLPLTVYVISYLPWVALGNRITDSWPPGNSGQTLLQLTQSMYDYHNNLRATHAASSPWWAWPLDLKPVWFYQGSFADGTAASIYDAGNLVLWWLSIPALAFCAWQAFRRRSLGLALVCVGFAWQWLSWSRIDRATFQYHYYTSLPFLFLALAYFLAELWHGASARTWLVARLSAALALVGPALLWLSRTPLCAYVRVTDVNPQSQACVSLPPGDIILTSRTAATAFVMVAAGLYIVRQLTQLDDGGRGEGLRQGLGRLGALLVTAAVAAAGVILASRFVPDDVLYSVRGFAPEVLAVVVVIPLGALGWYVVTARDGRRFVAGALFAIGIWFVILYPNIAALPLPSTLVNSYQGILPTYLYPFQFPVNTDPAGALPRLVAMEPAVLLGALALTSVIVGYSAIVWRIALAERRVRRAGGPSPGDGTLLGSGEA